MARVENAADQRASEEQLGGSIFGPTLHQLADRLCWPGAMHAPAEAGLIEDAGQASMG
jgi:hypothetical protein